MDVCTHPSGKSHVCQCGRNRNHSSLETGCERYKNVTQVDPHEESSPFVEVVEMPTKRTF